MGRSADYTIKGFLYQFHKTILELLTNPEDTEVTVEGIIEDIDIIGPKGTTAIQCKYHEAKEKYVPSAIYKPLLQMMSHFRGNQDKDITYVLFSHFPDRNEANPLLVTAGDLKAALATTNTDLKGLVADASGVDINAFLKKFRSEPGPNFDDLAAQVGKNLQNAGFDGNDVEVLALPNAITIVADLSTRHLASERIITGRRFLERLRTIKKTTISRWTLALKSKARILDTRRKQLKLCLEQNQRERFLIVDVASLSDFSENFILFVDEFLKKYHFKQVHTCTPLLCVSVNAEEFDQLCLRLYAKKIQATDGRIAGRFFEERLFRDPLTRSLKGGSIRREFDLRFVTWDNLCTVLPMHKPDDIYVIGAIDLAGMELNDINIEQLEVENVKEAKFLMGVSDGIE